ncbi:hypothetical protein NCAST_32_08660 [Nocardia asteroides NBRC 15531]|uniref:Uncharacterized protein n=1 Tax=Nocardia asteroides NBRC 15531 TaxID=1110697 RepID=U5EMR3_NOCAS|nr:hypothetical protein NCAST_32_08660 [Nocardia asteroides NBRC 15531]
MGCAPTVTPGYDTLDRVRTPDSAKPPDPTGFQGFRGFSSDDHSGGKPAEPVAIQFQKPAARLTSRAMTSRAVLPIKLS